MVDKEMVAFYAKKFGAIRASDEAEDSFRLRVAALCRQSGLLIEATEMEFNERYERSETVQTAIVGNLARKLQGIEDRNSVGDDLAAGFLVQNPKPIRSISPDLAVLFIQLFGPQD